MKVSELLDMLGRLGALNQDAEVLFNAPHCGDCRGTDYNVESIEIGDDGTVWIVGDGQ